MKNSNNQLIRRPPALILGLLVLIETLSAGPNNVIFFIGDGMGPEQVRATGIYQNGAAGTLGFEQLPARAEVTTYSANDAITDSAAAATAMATGVKVNNGVVSMAYPGDGSEFETVLEYVKARGMTTGLVTTTCMTHATPACFGAHEPSRSNMRQIAADYLTQSRPNVLLGGGANGMTVAAARKAGYQVVTNRTELLAIDTETATHVSGQFGKSHLPYEYDGVGALPHLREMTDVALRILDNDPDGFFLLVEGGRIDHAGHDNDLARLIPEVLEFDNAIGVAITWAEGRDDTLIMVTADHETGGLTVTENNGAGVLPTVTWSTKGHSPVNVPAYAWGAGSEWITGVLDNTDFFRICLAASPDSLAMPAGAATLSEPHSSR